MSTTYQTPTALVGRPVVDRLAEGRILLARGFHLGSVIRVDTPEGSVVIDTTGGEANAAAARDGMNRIAPSATRHLVYTHGHLDHIGGASALVDESTEHVIAQALLPDIHDRDHGCLEPWTRRIRSWQAGRPVETGPGAAYGEGEDGFIPPTLTFDHDLDVECGDLTFRLAHTEGETRDHLMVWIPEIRTLMPGDLFYHAFPNLSSPAIGPRPIEGWMRSLERMIGLGAELLVPSHGEAVVGAANVHEVLTTYLAAIRHVWDHATASMNDGVGVDDAARTVALPDHLAPLPWLAERYGTVQWGVRAVYDGLTGWFDGSPASLDPLPPRERDRELVALAGGDAIVARGRSLLEDGRAQLALEMATVAASANPLDAAANLLIADCCRVLGKAATSLNAAGFYISGKQIAESRLAQ